MGMVFVDLKKHSTLVIIKFSVGSWNLMVFCIGNWPGLDQTVQNCKVNGVDLQIENIDIEVPRGSFHAPLLFLFI